MNTLKVLTCHVPLEVSLFQISSFVQLEVETVSAVYASCHYPVLHHPALTSTVESGHNNELNKQISNLQM